MKVKKKILAVACVCMLMAVSVLGTIAYFTDQEAVTNTFTVGKVGITLDEAKVDKNGVAVSTNERTEEGNEYHLLPGRTYLKDPTVTVTEGSEDCYLRMIVTVENMDQLKEAITPTDAEGSYYEEGIFLLQMLCTDEYGINTWASDVWPYQGYTPSEDGKTGTYEFRYAGDSSAQPGIYKKDSEVVLSPLFEKITIPGDIINNADLEKLGKVKIKVTAHAIQAAGFDDADAAWTAFDSQNPDA